MDYIGDLNVQDLLDKEAINIIEKNIEYGIGGCSNYLELGKVYKNQDKRNKEKKNKTRG